VCVCMSTYGSLLLNPTAQGLMSTGLCLMSTVPKFTFTRVKGKEGALHE